jgi:hypothetical protein
MKSSVAKMRDEIFGLSSALSNLSFWVDAQKTFALPVLMAGPVLMAAATLKVRLDQTPNAIYTPRELPRTRNNHVHIFNFIKPGPKRKQLGGYSTASLSFSSS